MQIYLIDIATGDITRITDEPDPTGVGGAYQPDWSPDGRSIIHTRVRFDDQQDRSSKLYVMNADGNDVMHLPTGASTDSEPSWSPDGSKVAFVTGRDGATEIYAMNIDGTGLTRVTEHPGGDFGPSWSPDATQIAFASSRDGDAGIYVANSDGSEVTRLTDNGSNPDWMIQEPEAEPTPKQSDDDSSKYVGFRPDSRLENEQIVMPLTFVDGSSAEAVAPPDLGIQDMSAAIYTSGGLGGIDRTIDFNYGDGSVLMHEGPIKTYEGVDGSTVELWKPEPGTPAGCPNLVYRFGDWFVGVRTCQDDLTESEEENWARLLRGEVTDGGFLVLSARDPLVLQETGGHEGPEMILGYERANWIELEPGECDPARIPDEGDIRTMEDRTRVSFSRIGGADSKIEYNWYAEWCEDGLMRVQVSYAYKDFAEAAAEGFRLRDIVLAYPRH